MKTIFKIVVLSISIVIFSCEKDTVEADPQDNKPNVSEDCFDVIDLSTDCNNPQTISFINANEGWLVGEGLDNASTRTLSYTNDGGLTWTLKNTDLGVHHAGSVSASFIKFYNSTDGYMISEYEAGPGGSRLKYTTDQGQTWTVISGSDIGTWDVVAVNNTNAVFIGHHIYGHNDGVLYQVSNSSHEIVQTIDLPSTLDLFTKVDMHLAEDGTINVPVSRVNVGSGLYIAHSSNYGTSWTYSEIDLDATYKMDFPTDNTGYVIGGIGNDGALCKTTDGGATWTTKSTPNTFLHTNFFDAQNGLAIQQGQIYKTTDGAETWTEVSCFSDSQEHNPSRGVAYVSLEEWYAIGTRYVSSENKSYSEFYIYEENK